MIYVTGDTHGDFRRFNKENFPEQKEMTKEDYVIICGDFGGIWAVGKEDKEERYWLKWLSEKNFTLLFVDGNHENFDRLYAYPKEEWHGGLVHKIQDNVLHLTRGQVFTLEGKKFFTFGGASSHDISGGILDPNDPEFKRKKARLNKGMRPYRIRNVSWWEQELPSDEEMREGLKNLALNDYTVDYILTHCCASSTQAILSHGDFKPDRLTDYLDDIRAKTKFKRWFFGHYHSNRYVNTEEVLLYQQITRIL
ncbi:MAG: metallophosphoesterase [Lachnospiraceae bacterium]|nr:metallophosphoesterase [Lachnospiraceae bacterium]